MGKASIVSSLGEMDSANTYSFEQLVLDDEMISAVRKVHQGLSPAVFEEELSVIYEVGWSGNYLSTEHTLKHYKNFWRPSLMTRDRFDTWVKKKKSIVDRCREGITEILRNAPPSVLDSDLEHDLKKILAERGIIVPEEL
jgi:trimethylamine--corrinoid protein Co-methyltransferase